MPASLYAFVKRLEEADEAANRAIGSHGAALLGPKSRVLTHCNAGSLATAFYGTALGVVYAAAEQGKIEHVYADETRPVGQGARLTVWELARAGVPCTLLCDSMAASVMRAGLIDAVVVGADRIAANGDTANKIRNIRRGRARPSSWDPVLRRGPLFHRGRELFRRNAHSHRTARGIGGPSGPPSRGVEVFNPAFDVTPADLITAIVTEQGVFKPCELEGAFGRD